MSVVEIRAEQPKALSVWQPKWHADKGVYFCERLVESDGKPGVETWGAYLQAPGGERKFCVGHFPAKANAAAICAALNEASAQDNNALASIYGLYDSRGNLRYIGKANNPAKRLLSHMRDARRLRKTPLHCWLNKHGKPEMRVLIADCADWIEAERRLIAKYRAEGARLLNLADGGDEPGCPIEVRKANGRKLAKRLRDDPLFARIRYLKASFGRRLCRGEVNDVARAKLRYAGRKAPHLFGAWANLPNADGTPCNGD